MAVPGSMKGGWPLMCRWMCSAAKKRKKKKKRDEIMKEKYCQKNSANCEVTVCTRPLWLRLYLPLLPFCAWPPPLSYLYFDHYSFFLQTSLLLWLHTQGRTHAPFLRVFSPLFFFPSFTPWASPWLWSTSQPWTSLSPFLFFLCCFTIFPCCTSCVPLSLFLWVYHPSVPGENIHHVL